MVVGQLEIQLLANMARLQTDMDNAKRLVSDSVAKMTQVLGAIGIGISVAGFNGLVRSVVDLGDKFNDLRKITGLTADQLTGLEKVAALNGSSLDQVSKAVGIMSKNIVAGSDALNMLGISSKQANGEFRSSLDVLLDVSDRFSRMEDGVQKAALAQEIFGKSGRELIPLLNEGRAALQSQIESYGLASGVTNQLAEDSDRFNDTLTLLRGKVDAVKTSFVAELLPTLNQIGAAMLTTGQSTNQFSFAASVVVPVIKGLAIAGFTVIDTFRGMGREIGARAAQLAAFANLDFSGAKFIGEALAEDNKKARAEYDKFVDTIMNGGKAVEEFTDTQKEYLRIEQQLPGVIEKTSRATEKKNKEFNLQLYLLKQYDDEARRAREITQSVATEQEIYNQKLEELNRLKPYLTIETYDRALAKLSETNKKVEVSTRQTTDEVSQLWMQAGRNIQSTLANSIFNFFDDGLKGMLRNVISTVGRIASEFAALKIAQNIGLSQMFSSGGGTGGTGATNALSIASLLSGGKNLISSGFGIPSLVGRGLSMLPGSIGAFGGGLAGTSAGVFSAAGGAGTAFIGGAGTAIGGTGMGAAAGLGSMAAAAAGPLVIAAAADMVFRSLAGNKTLGNKVVDSIPVIGSLGALLFGHGPMKFRQQSLQFNASQAGAEGDFTNVFRAKGGLMVGNKHKSVSQAFSEEQQIAFDNTLKGFYTSAHNAAVNLGLSADLVDNFTKQVQIKSEKGKTVTEEAINQMFADIGNEIARAALPTVDSFRKAGEDSMATLTRLNSEFETLQQGAMNLGVSADYAKQLVSGLGIATRTAYLEAAGGTETFLADTASFNEKFLTKAEQMAPILKFVEDGLTGLGFSANLTREEFKTLTQTLLTSASDADKATGALLLHNNALYDLVLNYRDSLKPIEDVSNSIEDLSEIAKSQAKTNMDNLFGALQRSVEAERKTITDAYNQDLLIVNKSIQDVSASINKLKSLSSALGSTVDALRPLSREESADISRALDVLKSNNITGARSGFELAREQAKTVNLVADLGSLTDAQLSVEERSLRQLESQQRTLQDGFDNEMERLDGILEQAQAQIDAMNGLNTSVVSLTEAIANFNLGSLQGGGGAIGGGNVAAGNLNISNQEIIDYFKTEHSARQIYIDAVSRGISSAQIVNSGAVTQAQADQFFKDNPKIPHFASGGYHRGGLRIVGERGPELERTGPSNITSNSDLKKSMGIDELITEFKKLRELWEPVIQGGTAVRIKQQQTA